MARTDTNTILLFFIRKILFYVIALFMSLTLVWLLPRLMPGDPIGMLVAKILGGAGGGVGGGGGGGGAGGTSIAELLYEYWVKKFGLDKPWYEQYIIYLSSCLSFNFGISIQYYPARVLDLITRALPWSLGLLVPAIIIGWIIGNLLGALAAFRGGIFDKVLYPIFLIFSRMPYYWFALILVYLLSTHYRIFPPGGAYSPYHTPSFSITFIVDFLHHYTLPFISVLLPFIGGQAIGMRAMTLYEVNSDYLNYTESLGIGDRRLLSYAFRNAILTQISGLPLQFASTFAGQLVTEVVFGYPGIGYLLYDAIINQDFPLIQGSFMMIIVVTLVGNFLMDLLYAYIDPRIRIAYREET